MHEVCSPFMAAVLRSLGRPSKVLPLETRESFDLGRSRCRGGECLPCPATLGAFLATLKAEGGDPGDHALFMPTAEGPCRFGQYCTLQKQALDDLGLGAAKVVSWNSTDSYDGTSMSERRRIWKALALGDVLFKMRCRLVAKEKRAGQTEDLYLESRERLAQVIEQAGDLEGAVKDVRDRFLRIPTLERERPLVGVVGEIYVRNNAFCNQNVVRAIEAAGGEAWVAPFSEWIIYTAWMEAWFKGFRRGGFLERMGGLIKNRFLAGDSEAWHRAVSPILDQRMEPPIEETVKAGAAWMPIDFEGESIITVGRTIEFAKRDGAALVLNAAPFACMPGAMTSGILKAVERDLGIPVVPMFYDGQGDINGLLESHLSAIHRQRARSGLRVDFRAAGEQ
jgi:predicted nucleotide-binding protein (sugar kinase/HSP70/actin superfamily)